MNPTADTLELAIPDESSMAALGAALAKALEPDTRIHLTGDLGTGKTTLARTLLRALGHTGRVRSPSFTLLEPYNSSSFNLYHFDFYRLSDEKAWLEAGFDEYLDGRGIVVIEWPEMAGDTLPEPDLAVSIAFSNADDSDDAGEARHVIVRACGERGAQCLSRLRQALATSPMTADGSGAAGS